MRIDDLLDHESDIEELRRVARALHAQLQQTIRQLQRKCDQLALYTGNKDELQQTLELIEQLTGQAKAAEQAAQTPKPPPRSGRSRARRRSRTCRAWRSTASSTPPIAPARAVVARSSR